MLSKELLNILACPKCKGKLEEKGMFLVCFSCKIAYPILENNVPDFLEEDAISLENAEKRGFKHNLKL